MVNVPHGITTQVLLFETGQSDLQPVLQRVTDAADTSITAVATLSALASALLSSQWDALVMPVELLADSMTLVAAQPDALTLIVICRDLSEIDRAYTLTQNHVSYVILWDEVQHIPFILHRERRRQSQQTAAERKPHPPTDDYLQRTENRFRSVIESFSDPIVFLDQYQVIRYVNKAFTHLLDYPLEAVLSKPFSHFVVEAEQIKLRSQFDQGLQQTNSIQIIETQLERADGIRETAEVTMHSMRDPVGQPSLIIHLDVITQRKRTEERIQRLNRTLSVLTDINQSIVRIHDISKLFETACEIAVEKGMFRMAWVGLPDSSQTFLTPVAHAGIVEDYLDKLKIRFDDPIRNRGPAASAFRTGHHVICNDIAHDPRMTAWRDNALQLGYRALIALPLAVGGEVRGVITLYTDVVDFFLDPDEIRLVDELANDIAFAMSIHEQQLQRQKTEEALLESESRYHRVLDDLLEGCQILSYDWRYLYMNDVTLIQSHLSREMMIGKSMLEMLPDIVHTPVFAVMKRAMDERIIQRTENEYRYPDGTSAWFQLNIQPVPEGILILTLDITERKQAEAAFKRYTQHVELLHEIDKGIMTATSVEQIVEVVIERLRQLMPCDRIEVALVDEAHIDAVRFSVNGSDTPAITKTQIAAATFERPNALHTTGLVQDLPAPAALPLWQQSLLDAGLRSMMQVPLVAQNVWIGFLTLAATAVDFFTPDHEDIVRQVANQLAVAIRQAQLSAGLNARATELSEKVEALEKAEAALTQYARRIELLHEIDKSIISANGIEELAEMVSVNLRLIIPCPLAGINLVDESTGEFVIFRFDSDYETHIKQGERIAIPPGWFERFNDNHVLVIDDMRLSPHPRYQQLAQEGLRSIMNVMIVGKNRPIGYLALASDKVGYFTGEHQDIVLQIASQLAIAIRQLQLNDELRQSEERYRKVVEDQTDLICRYRADFTLTFVNHAYSELYNKTPDELIGTNFSELMPPEDRPMSLAYIAQLGSQKPVSLSEHRSRLPDGSIRWIQWKDRVIMDADGKIIEYQGVGRDITDRKALQAERDNYTQKIEELSRFLQSALDAFPASAVVLDTDGRIIAYNNPWKTFAMENSGDIGTFYEGANYIGVCDVAQGGETQDASATAAGIRAVIEGRQDNFYLEYPCHSPTEQRWYAVRVTPFLEPTPRRVVVAHSNITERKLSERELGSLYNATSYLFKADSLLNLGQQIVAAVIHEFQHSDCGIMLYDRKQDKIIRLARTGEFDIRPESPLRIDGPGLVPLALRTGKTVYVPDVEQDPNYVASVSRTRSEIVIPLKTANGVIGVLDLQSDELDAFGERERRILLAYAERAAPAIENRQLYEEINQHAAVLEWRVAQRTAEVIYSKNRVEAILNNSTDGILLVYAKSGIQQSNAMFNTLFNCHEDDYFGKPLSELVRAEDRDRLAAAIEHVIRTREAENIEITARRMDGTLFDAEFGVGYIRTEENREQGVVCVIRDITKRKLAEQALQATVDAEMAFQRYLKDLHEISIELTQIDSLDEFYRSTVAIGLDRLGFDRMALILYDRERKTGIRTYGTDEHGHITDERSIPIDLAEDSTLMRALRSEERFYFLDDSPLYQANTIIGTGWHASAVLWNGRYSIGWLVVDNFVHQQPASKPQLEALMLYAMTIGSLLVRKQTEAAQRESEEKFRMLNAAAPIASVITDQTGKILLINELSEALFGYSRNELIGQSIDVLVPEDVRPAHTHLRDGYAANPRMRHMGNGLELFAQRKDGSEFPVEIKLSYIKIQTGIMVIAFIVDITERKKAEDALLQAFEKERELSDLKSRFVSMSSHEFRTPLANILAMTETLSSYRHKMNDGQISDRLDSIRGQVNRLKGIMDDVLQLTRIQAKRIEFQPLDMDLDAFCREVLAELKHRTDVHHQINYTCLVTPPVAKLDKKLIRQILDNLLSNALKYSTADRPIDVQLTYQDEVLILSIHDQGIGIPDADTKHLFEPFHRASNVGTISGTGLGLVIAKEAVEMHSGTIDVQSRVGQGTTITIHIPVSTQGFKA